LKRSSDEGALEGNGLLVKKIIRQRKSQENVIGKGSRRARRDSVERVYPVRSGEAHKHSSLRPFATENKTIGN